MMTKAITGIETMVVSPHYLATAAGARILSKGGNAFDAAVAVSACLAVVYPHMTGLGGDAFWLVYSSADQAVRAYNASGRSGYMATREQFAGEASIPLRGPRSVLTVPGMVDGWDAISREYGRLPLRELLEPAIAYAAQGFPVSGDQYATTAQRALLLSEQPNTARIYLPGGRIPAAGSKLVQRLLGESLKKIAANGRDAFYKGPLGAEISSYLQGHGGLLTMEDFAAHTGEWDAPASGAYRGYDLYQAPPNSQGFTGIMALHILENYDLKSIPHGSYDYYHLTIEALKLSLRDRNRYLTDPGFADIPLERLLSKAYARELAGEIRMDRTIDVDAKPMGGDTAYAAVVDGEGNAVSFIQSLYFEFGSAVTAGETGIILQNRGSFFSLEQDHVNRLEPRKRTFHTLMPAMACRDGKPAILYGTQGGEGQPQTQTALVTRIIDYRMDPQKAVSEPRWLWGRTWGEPNKDLKVESRIANDAVDKLKRSGHSVKTVQAYDGIMGHANAVVIGENGFRSGGTDPRSDGAAMGW
ncbi:MAG: gamma-glutamyltransferase [Paenibacillaceae bacterium]|jgi:gamma-glutamyltranspeptidase/glutathione hydrolase|nr:gamma-glutamyltransferase [Paenibacillaceae bacterium]